MQGGSAIRREDTPIFYAPLEGDARWSASVPRLPRWTLWDYVKALFQAKKGRWRLVVFIVSDQHPTSDAVEVSRAEADQWLQGGAVRLPTGIRGSVYSPDHYCKALIYEFVAETQNHEPEVERPSGLPGKTHLMLSGVWAGISGTG